MIAMVAALIVLAALSGAVGAVTRRAYAPTRGRHTAAYIALHAVPAPEPVRRHVPLVLTGRAGRPALMTPGVI